MLTVSFRQTASNAASTDQSATFFHHLILSEHSIIRTTCTAISHIARYGPLYHITAFHDLTRCITCLNIYLRYIPREILDVCFDTQLAWHRSLAAAFFWTIVDRYYDRICLVRIIGQESCHDGIGGSLER